MPEPDFARMTALGRLGVVLLCVGAGALLGLMGTFAHQSLPPVGITLALATVALFVAGLRVWGGVRAPAASGALGVGLVVGILLLPQGGTVLVPANTAGYTWLYGLAAIAFIALAWPNVQRVHRRAPVTMVSTPESPEDHQL